jgi:ABC-type nitrate/sulfonate/bicarbonate transport system substrate-binding protein
MNRILDQLARTGLLPDDVAKPILAGDMPPIEDIAMALVIGAMDAHAVVVGDPQSTWNEKRLARMALAVAFLGAMAVVGKTGEPT